MVDIFIDSFKDTIKVMPLLFLIFLAVDYLMLKANNENKLMDKLSKYNCLEGSMLGVIPQCGIPVAAANLYSSGYITLGMLIAVFISSSDEALIIMGAHPEKLSLVLQLLSIKVVIATIAGILVNKFIKEKRNRIKICSADCQCPMCRKHKNIVFHNLVYTIKITFFLIITVFIINLGIEKLGQESFNIILGKNTFMQPIFAAFIGMIPSCISSVVLAEAFIKGSIGLGTLTAGLCANAGYGILIVVKELPIRKSLKIILLIQGISILAGELIYFYKG